MTARYKSGSRLQAMWEKYESGGADEATAAGLALGVTSGCIRTCIRTWSKESGAPVPTNGAPRPEKITPRPMITKPAVVVKFDRERLAFLIAKGPEVSTIRWADTREDRHYPNDVLEFGGESDAL